MKKALMMILSLMFVINAVTFTPVFAADDTDCPPGTPGHSGHGHGK